MLYSVALGINDVQLYMNLCSCTILFVVLLAPENSTRALPLEKEKFIICPILGQARMSYRSGADSQSLVYIRAGLWPTETL